MDKIGHAGLLPEDIAGVADLFAGAAGGMAVEDRAAESDAVLRVAVGAQRHVPAGHDELELVLVAGLAEEGDALLGPPFLASGVVAELLEEAGVPVRIDQAL